MLDARPEWKKKVLLISSEGPGIRMLRGMERRQILMKMLTGSETEDFCAWLAKAAEEPRAGCQICFEYNPTSMI